MNTQEKAHFAIIGVHYENNQIEKVRLVVVEYDYEDGDLRISDNVLRVGRQFVIDILENLAGTVNIFTATKGRRYWEKGDQVILYDNEFITTKGNQKRKDNLGNLPEF